MIKPLLFCNKNKNQEQSFLQSACLAAASHKPHRMCLTVCFRLTLSWSCKTGRNSSSTTPKSCKTQSWSHMALGVWESMHEWRNAHLWVSVSSGQHSCVLHPLLQNNCSSMTRRTTHQPLVWKHSFTFVYVVCVRVSPLVLSRCWLCNLELEHVLFQRMFMFG